MHSLVTRRCNETTQELCACFDHLAADCRLVISVYEVTFVPLILQRDLSWGRRAASGELLLLRFLNFSNQRQSANHGPVWESLDRRLMSFSNYAMTAVVERPLPLVMVHDHR